MPLLADTVKDLATLGCNITITHSNFSADTVKEIVRIASGREAHVTLHAGNYAPETMRAVALIGRANLTIVI